MKYENNEKITNIHNYVYNKEDILVSSRNLDKKDDIEYNNMNKNYVNSKSHSHSFNNYQFQFKKKNSDITYFRNGTEDLNIDFPLNSFTLKPKKISVYGSIHKFQKNKVEEMIKLYKNETIVVKNPRSKELK